MDRSRTWGLWWLGDAEEPTPGWVEDCGDTGPVTKADCEKFLACTKSSHDLYRIVQWSKNGPVRTLVADWYEILYTLKNGEATTLRAEDREVARRCAKNTRKTTSGPVKVTHVRRWRLMPA
jgi:hypothetical protein